jgi:multiple sugar transport system substrate-binding protein
MKKGFFKSMSITLSVFVLLSISGFGGISQAFAKNSSVTLKFAAWDVIPKAHDYIKAFEAKYPNIKVDVTIIPDNYSEKLNAMVAAKTAPDVMLTWENDSKRFIQNNVVIPLDSYIKNTKEFKASDFIPAVNSINQMFGGKTYSLPWGYASEILYYNKNMFDKAHVAYPNDKWTWKDFEDAAKKLTIVKDGKTIQWGANSITFPGVWYSTIGAAGDDIIAKDGSLALGNGLKKALQWQYDLTNKYKVSPAPSADTNVVDLFAAGKAAMSRNGSWLTAQYKNIKDFKWDISTLPKGTRQYSSLHTGFFQIYKGSKNKDAAWKFIEFMMSDTGQKVLGEAFGNPSARKSVTAKGYYQSTGPNGPRNWNTIDKTAAFGRFGYVLLPAGVTDKLVQQFNSVLQGQMTIDEVITKGLEQAKQDMNN